MGGMGREFNGGYAQFTVVPIDIVFPFKSSLPWKVLGALPEMFQTSSGSLNAALEVQKGEVLLIRGGTSSIGLMSAQLAEAEGLSVVATTRNPEKVAYLKENGVDEVIIDDGSICAKEREIPQRCRQGVGADWHQDLVRLSPVRPSSWCGLHDWHSRQLVGMERLPANGGHPDLGEADFIFWGRHGRSPWT